MRAKLFDLVTFWRDDIGWPKGWVFKTPNPEFLQLAQNHPMAPEVVGVSWALGELSGPGGGDTFYAKKVSTPTAESTFQAWAEHQTRLRAMSGRGPVEVLAD